MVIQLTDGLAHRPNDIVLLNNRGVAYFELGNYESALADFDKVLRLNPDDAEAYFNRGNTKMMLRDVYGACSDWHQAQSRGIELQEWIIEECEP